VQLASAAAWALRSAEAAALLLLPEQLLLLLLDLVASSCRYCWQLG
jgi:hypothetical protein